MILLLGGTADTAPIATGLLAAGHRVLVSMATSFPLPLPAHEKLVVRRGELAEPALSKLLITEKIELVVDATHPYAVQISELAQAVAASLSLPYLCYRRPDSQLVDICWADDHQQAAKLAVAVGAPVILTTGSRNLAPYLAAAQKAQVQLVARVLPCVESLLACKGLPAAQVVAAKGPFSVADNIALIERFGAGVLVTKDGGAAGGMPAKVEAAAQAGILLVVVRRPQVAGKVYSSYAELLVAVEQIKRGGFEGSPGHLEIEYRYLLAAPGWVLAPFDLSAALKAAVATITIKQAYLEAEVDSSHRVRMSASDDGVSKYYETRKRGRGAALWEQEREITAAQFAVLWSKAQVGGVIEKKRYRIPLLTGTEIIELDIFAGDFAGLVIAEIEVACQVAPARSRLPRWLRGALDITTDGRFRNAALARQGWPTPR